MSVFVLISENYEKLFLQSIQVVGSFFVIGVEALLQRA